MTYKMNWTNWVASLDEKLDPNKKWGIAKFEGLNNEVWFTVAQRYSKTPICQNHFSNSMESVIKYIESINHPKQTLCLICGNGDLKKQKMEDIEISEEEEEEEEEEDMRDEQIQMLREEIIIIEEENKHCRELSTKLTPSPEKYIGKFEEISGEKFQYKNNIYISSHFVAKILEPSQSNEIKIYLQLSQIRYPFPIVNMIHHEVYDTFSGFVLPKWDGTIDKEFELVPSSKLKTPHFLFEDYGIFMRKLFDQLSLQIRHLHKIGFIHYDIEARNIAFSKDLNGNYNFSLLDFGSAIPISTNVNKLTNTQWNKISTMFNPIQDSIFEGKILKFLEEYNDCYILIDYIIFVKLLNKMKNSSKHKFPNSYYIEIFKSILKDQEKGKEIIQFLERK